MIRKAETSLGRRQKGRPSLLINDAAFGQQAQCNIKCRSRFVSDVHGRDALLQPQSRRAALAIGDFPASTWGRM